MIYYYNYFSLVNYASIIRLDFITTQITQVKTKTKLVLDRGPCDNLLVIVIIYLPNFYVSS